VGSPFSDTSKSKRPTLKDVLHPLHDLDFLLGTRQRHELGVSVAHSVGGAHQTLRAALLKRCVATKIEAAGLLLAVVFFHVQNCSL
jgi:hypothetical protein